MRSVPSGMTYGLLQLTAAGLDIACRSHFNVIRDATVIVPQPGPYPGLPFLNRYRLGEDVAGCRIQRLHLFAHVVQHCDRQHRCDSPLPRAWSMHAASGCEETPPSTGWWLQREVAARNHK